MCMGVRVARRGTGLGMIAPAQVPPSAPRHYLTSSGRTLDARCARFSRPINVAVPLGTDSSTSALLARVAGLSLRSRVPQEQRTREQGDDGYDRCDEKPASGQSCLHRSSSPPNGGPWVNTTALSAFLRLLLKQLVRSYPQGGSCVSRSLGSIHATSPCRLPARQAKPPARVAAVVAHPVQATITRSGGSPRR